MHVGTRLAAAIERIKGIFQEVPGTRLNLIEAVQLSGLEPRTCRIVLEALADAGFLTLRPGGFFIRRSDTPTV